MDWLRGFKLPAMALPCSWEVSESSRDLTQGKSGAILSILSRGESAKIRLEATGLSSKGAGHVFMSSVRQ